MEGGKKGPLILEKIAWPFQSKLDPFLDHGILWLDHHNSKRTILDENKTLWGMEKSLLSCVILCIGTWYDKQ